MLFIVIGCLVLTVCAFWALRRSEFGYAAVFIVLLMMLANAKAHADASRVFTVSVVIDTDFVHEVGEDAARNWVDTTLQDAYNIYALQIGLQMKTVDVKLSHVADDTQPQFLLLAVQRARTLDTIEYETGATIFFTRRSLAIGSNHYAGWGVGPPYSASAAVVVKLRDGPYTDSEVVAHELGHVFGIPHDGDGVCANEPQAGFIMSASGYTSHSFSPCSVKHLREIIDGTPALNPAAFAPPVQVSVVPASVTGGGAFDWLIIVALCAFVIYQQFRIAHWRDEARKRGERLMYVEAGLRNTKDQWFKAESEAKALRGVIAERIRFELTERLKLESDGAYTLRNDVDNNGVQ